MKSTAAIAAILAAGAMAQPHNHVRHAHPRAHAEKRGEIEERDVVTHWETHWVYHTVYVDVTRTVGSGSPGIFITSTTSEEEETTSSTSSEESTTSSSSTSSTEEAYTSPTTSTPEPEPTTSTTEVEPPSSTHAEATSSAPSTSPSEGSGSGSGSGFSADYSGFITYYDIGLGACGWDDSGRTPSGSMDDPMIVAISYNVYFSSIANPNNMPLCGQIIQMESPDNPGVYAYGQIRDACQACTTAGDLDVNIQGMQQFYPGGDAVAKGKGSITWKIVS